ncbi:hypothetical protein TL16_g03658 [Triparma laevis f. inornata]|uniref:Uncharacterized protein n=2 Tax=Triparma laevis TaxID=1534972 RepID=A0A9W6ZJ54_9STRA|nr:hypothetical protein TrLO_g5128 [Triparma laevis f. longispina]GMH63237.1 hypothetical protein TL16_g03658 [Triparma laevis f. inornata]
MSFIKGALVEVAPRTWPGINKPGGIGKVMLSTCTSCNVKYILGGTDKEIPLEFVKLHEDLGSREKKPVEVVNMDASPQRERRVHPKKAEDTSLRERDTNQVSKKQKSQPTIAKKANTNLSSLPKSSTAGKAVNKAKSIDSTSSSSSTTYVPKAITEALSTPSILPASPPPVASPQLLAFTTLLNTLFDSNDGEAAVPTLTEQWSGDPGEIKRMMVFLEGQNRIFVSDEVVYKV